MGCLKTFEDTLCIIKTYISAKDVAVSEDPEEVGDGEGADHKDGGQEGRVGTRGRLLRRL